MNAQKRMWSCFCSDIKRDTAGRDNKYVRRAEFITTALTNYLLSCFQRHQSSPPVKSYDWTCIAAKKPSTALSFLSTPNTLIKFITKCNRDYLFVS